ncbi:MAG: sulfatase-like hydrolase/transferase, partial [Clostridia bacterium]|nr:sulfatase-like hydrolase/transferase [Clostridia bacterium]
KVRNYVSDEAVYNKIIRLYHDNLDNEQPLVFFCVTMQNHGGFTNFNQYPDQFPTLAEDMDALPASMKNKQSVAGYSALVQKSDAAFGQLVDFFRDEEEPTVILMYGDHQPNSTVTKPILSHFGVDEETPDWNVRSQQFVVPFVMWANYDIEEEQGIVTSLNYLNIMLTEAAGFELSGYQNFRKQLSEKYPVITANFCINDRGELFAWNELDIDADEDLRLYKQFQYNHSFDKKNSIKGFYD